MSSFLLIARPDRPRDLELTDLAERSVRLTWIPGDDNNSPITGQSMLLYLEIQRIITITNLLKSTRWCLRSYVSLALPNSVH